MQTTRQAVSSAGPVATSEARSSLLRDEVYVDVAEIFRALGDSTRAKIVHLLSGGDRRVSDIAESVGVSEPAVSQHLRLLRSLHIVRGRRDGRKVFYSLEDEHVRTLLSVALHHREELDPVGQAAQ